MGHLLFDKLLEMGTFSFDTHDFPHQKIEEPSAKLGGQIKLVNFVPESIVPNVVECFLDIKKGHYYSSPQLKLSMV